MTHIEVLTAIAQCYGQPRYLEIGTGDGGCFCRVAPHCSVAHTVDVPENPYGAINRVPNLASEETTWFCRPGGSDDLFAEMLPEQRYDLIFVDGSHWYDQVKRDFENAASRLAPLGTIALHDTWSATEYEAAQGSDTAYLVAQEIEGDPAWQAWTMPIRPGLTLCRPNAPRFEGERS